MAADEPGFDFFCMHVSLCRLVARCVSYRELVMTNLNQNLHRGADVESKYISLAWAFTWVRNG
jgi:hypothetical protein